MFLIAFQVRWRREDNPQRATFRNLPDALDFADVLWGRGKENEVFAVPYAPEKHATLRTDRWWR